MNRKTNGVRVTFRLAPPSVARPLEIVLSPQEHERVEAAAAGQPLGTFVRQLVVYALSPKKPVPQGQDPIDLARKAAESLEMALGDFLRLLVVGSVGSDVFAKSVASGRVFVRRWGREHGKR